MVTTAGLDHTIHPIAPVYMSPVNTHKLMGFYMEALKTIIKYMVSASLGCFL